MVMLGHLSAILHMVWTYLTAHELLSFRKAGPTRGDRVNCQEDD